MNIRRLIALISLIGATACGVPTVHSPVVSPDNILDFNYLYARNCGGCHGFNGRGGPAIGLGDPVYLAIADDATIRRVTDDGVPGTSMPAFAKRSGGMLTDDQIAVIVSGIRSRWSKPNILRNSATPPYAATVPGDATRGEAVYVTYCSSCHGTNGRGATRASSVVDGSFLGLISDQGLRTVVIVGRPDLGAPDWRGDLPGKPMSDQDVSDVVAWLAAQRPRFPGQPYSTEAQLEGRFR
jgi:mono/diheme cytochrome c family protein